MGKKLWGCEPNQNKSSLGNKRELQKNCFFHHRPTVTVVGTSVKILGTTVKLVGTTVTVSGTTVKLFGWF